MPGGEAKGAGGRRPRILFCSYHCYLDPSSGAALAVRDLFALLAGRGWQCEVLCGSRLDFEEARSLPQLLRDQKIPFEDQPGPAGPVPWSVLRLRQGDVPIRFYHAPHSGAVPTRAEGEPFLALLEKVLAESPPDVVLAYGGHWLARATIDVVKRRGIPVVFWLYNLGYRTAEVFQGVDAVLVPSRFSQALYRRAHGLESTAIPCPLDWSWCHSPDVEGRYVTFVNPQPDKGVFWFAGLARELGRRRPDIPLLVVEGRGTASWLKQAGLDPATMPNLRVLPNTPDPRSFYRVSRLVVMPSLWLEAWGRVAAEACLNGIPVLASTRGGLPEVLAEAGFLFDVPARYTPETREVPTAEETAPWVETILRLWDDPAFYEAQRQRCLRAAEAWRPERLAPRYDAFFRAVLAAASTAAASTALASALAAPPAMVKPAATLCFVIPCMGRGAFLRQTLGRAVAQPGCACVVVDYSCPEHIGDWVETHYPQALVVREPGQAKYDQCRARNLGARAAASPWLCFCDADVLLEPSFAATVLPLLRPGCFYRPDLLEDLGLFGTFICSRADFERIGGYDEVYQGWGDADVDVYNALELMGVRPATFSVSLLRHLPHGDEERVRFYDNKDRWFNCAINRFYRVIKFHLLRLGMRNLTFEMRERLYRVVTDNVHKAMREGKALTMDVNIGSGDQMPGGWQLDCALTYRCRPPSEAGER